MLQPDDQSEIYIADEIVHRVQHLRLETLTFGSIMFDDLELEPQGPFMIEAIRSKMIGKPYSLAFILLTKCNAKWKENIVYAEGLRKRHAVFQDDLTDSPQESGSIDDLDGWHLLQSRENFEVLIKGFERELDHCEMELRNRSFKEQGILAQFSFTLVRQSQPNNSLSLLIRLYLDPKKQWLCSSKLTFADVCLGMALWHLEQLGFYKRLIAPRPHLTQYYGRIQKVDSFKKATTYPASSLRPPSTTTLIETRRVWQMPENPWSLMFLLLPFGMIGFIAFIDYMKPLGPRDPYYVPRLRSHFPSVQYRSTGSVLYTS